MALPSNSLSMELIEIASLRPVSRHIRRHTAKQLRKIQRSLDRFGHVRPILVTPDREIIDGHIVCEALKKNGATMVRAIVVRDLSPIEIRALRLMLHRSGDDALWDEAAVRDELQAMITAGLDLELSGFETPELDKILMADAPRAHVCETGRDIPPTATIAVSQPGDVWVCGPHRIGCGDARDLDFVQQVCGRRVANVCFADPRGSSKGHHQELLDGKAEISPDLVFTFLRDALFVMKASSATNALFYVCTNWHDVVAVVVAGNAVGMALENICVWIKRDSNGGGLYRNGHELVCVFRVGAEQPNNNAELSKYGRKRSNVWGYDERLSSHFAAKPIALISDVLRDVTKRGDLALDSFLGSGSTLMAAEETGRVCAGIELNPLSVDVAIRRWQCSTGGEAIHARSGKKFDDCTELVLPPTEMPS